MSFSVNYNYSAAVAIQALNATQDSLDKAISRSASGLRVQTAADDGIAYASSENIKNTVARGKIVLDTINSAGASADLGIATVNGLLDLANKMIVIAGKAADVTILPADSTNLNTQFKALLNTYQTLQNQTSLTTTGGTTNYALDFYSITGAATGQNLAVPGVAQNITTTWAADTAANARTAAAGLITLVTNLTTQGMALGQARSVLDTIKTTVTASMAAQNKAIGSLVDADMGEESAKIQSLQIKQQLNVQSISIANSDMRVLLTLFGA